jgi:GntR family transcriptional regulator, trigonelline degradation regulator
MQIHRVAAPVRSQVVHHLRRAITELRFPPGHRLAERDLCERTGASRTSIREALRQLEAEGLVTSVPNRGTIVAGLTAVEANEIYEVRAVLEPLAARGFVERGAEPQVHALREALEELRRAEGDVPAMLQAKSRFYDVLVEAAGNGHLRGILGGLHARVTALRGVSLSQPGRTARSLDELERLVTAIERRDAAAAARAAERHVRAAQRVAVAALDDDRVAA